MGGSTYGAYNGLYGSYGGIYNGLYRSYGGLWSGDYLYNRSSLYSSLYNPYSYGLNRFANSYYPSYTLGSRFGLGYSGLYGLGLGSRYGLGLGYSGYYPSAYSNWGYSGLYRSGLWNRGLYGYSVLYW